MTNIQRIRGGTISLLGTGVGIWFLVMFWQGGSLEGPGIVIVIPNIIAVFLSLLGVGLMFGDMTAGCILTLISGTVGLLPALILGSAALSSAVPGILILLGGLIGWLAGPEIKPVKSKVSYLQQS